MRWFSRGHFPCLAMSLSSRGLKEGHIKRTHKNQLGAKFHAGPRGTELNEFINPPNTQSKGDRQSQAYRLPVFCTPAFLHSDSGSTSARYVVSAFPALLIGESSVACVPTPLPNHNKDEPRQTLSHCSGLVCFESFLVWIEVLCEI